MQGTTTLPKSPAPSTGHATALPSEPTLFRIGAVSAITGSLLALITNVLHPRASNFENHPEPFLTIVARTDNWVPVHLGIMFASFLVLVGQVALYRSITDERGRALALLGFIFALVSNAVLVVWMALDAVAMKHLADAFVSAPPTERATAFRTATALERMSFALESFWFTLFWGITFILYGLAVALSDHYPKWLGWVAAICGVGTVTIGLVQVLYRLSFFTLSTNGAFAGILAVWIIVMSVLLWRRVGAEA